MFETKNIYTTLDDLFNYDKKIEEGFGGDLISNSSKNNVKITREISIKTIKNM